jgi:ATP-dependent RNA helicase DDX27
MKRRSTQDRRERGFRAGEIRNSHKVRFSIHLSFERTTIASLVLSKRQYETNFQKDKPEGPLTNTDDRKPKRDKFSGLTRRAKRRKLASEEESKEDRRSMNAAIRSAKKAARPARIGVPNQSASTQGKSKHKRKSGLSKVGFSHDQGSRVSRREGIRAKRGLVATKINGKRRPK